MKKRLILILFFLLAANAHFSYAQGTKIRVWEKTAIDQGLIGELLFQALEITQKEYGEYQIITSTEMEQDRALREIANSRLDLAHFVSTAEREMQATPIRIPIMQGLLGYRLCLIKDGNQDKFIGVTNKQQWIEKKISIGQHRNWPDTTILKSNGLHVATTYKRELLFQQLSKNRFDCFARGVNEISDEQLKHRSLGLVIENNILIHYQ